MKEKPVGDVKIVFSNALQHPTLTSSCCQKTIASAPHSIKGFYRRHEVI